ncbi:MAG: PQQ-binding-like beta-propeller repeat protein [Planctomycetota bacterium]|nr:PQQ-binding-like beta-propeller repeat protein [Planctomycetota bacterium]
MTSFPACRRMLSVLIALFLGAPPAIAQPDNPVYVDDSPRAWELLRRARDQLAGNESEAVRLYQELLDDYGAKLIPLDEATPDHFVNVRRRVLDELRDGEPLLARYRLMETAEAQRLLEAGELERLALTRPLTAPGLEAQLRLGQDALERAAFHAAVTWLESAAAHPDLAGREAAHAWFMLGLARHHLGLDEEASTAAARLRELGEDGNACLARLVELIEAGRGPDVRRGATPLDATGAANLDQLVAHPIWFAPLEDALLVRRHGSEAEARSPRSEIYQRLQREGALTTAVPAVTDDAVFINEGHVVRALDRYSGRSLWPRPFTDRPHLPAADRGYATAGDLNLITVEGDALVTITGHASAAERTGNGRVICLDAATGRTRWARSFDRLGDDDTLAGLFPYGRPILSEGSVCLLARRVSRPRLTDCYAVALDIEDGALRWIRHIASSGVRDRSGRPFSTMMEDGGDLFVATPVGAAARLDGATGLIRWLVRFPAPPSPRDRPRRPWELSGPLMINDRVYVITPDERRMVVLDRGSGAVLASHGAASRETFNAPRYLLGNDRFIYAVGSEVRAFSRGSLDRPAWSLPRRVRGADRIGSSEDDITLAGRVQLVDGALIVPARDALLIVADGSGELIRRIPVDAPGNPVAIGAQLALASADRVNMYMSLAQATQMLRQRITEAPQDPGPAISLLQLALRVEDPGLVLEAAELTRRALAAGADDPAMQSAQRELFELLLETHRRRLSATAREAEALYDALRAAANTTHQRAEHLIARGDWLVDRAPIEAVAAWQKILADPLLAASVRAEGGLLRPASFWAANRIGNAIDRHGGTIVARQSAEARIALEDIVGTEPVDPDALVELALRYPFAEASFEAAATADERRLQRGDERAALADLSAIYHLHPSRARARRLLGRIIELCLREGNTRQARLILDDLLAAFGDFALDTTRGPRRAGAWQAQLAKGDPPIRRPRIGARPGPATVLDGRLLPRHAESTGPMPPDRALLRAGDELRLITADELEPLWRAEVDDPTAQLIAFDRNEILLWAGESTSDPRLIARDAATGRIRWSTPRLADHLDAPLARERGLADRMPDGLPFDSRETIPVIGREQMYLVQRTGGVAAFSRADGAFPLWTRDRTLEEVHLAAAHEFGLVLAGRARSIDAPGDGLIPRLIVLDPRRGAVLHRLRPQGRSGVRWMMTEPGGGLLCATADGIECIDLLRGRRRWTNIALDVMNAPRGWRAGGRVIIERETGGGLLALRLADGALDGRFDVSAAGDWDPMRLDALHLDGDAVIARYRQRLIRYDAEGRILGADAIVGRRDYRMLLLAEDRLIVISQSNSRQVLRGDGLGRETHRTYRIYVLSEDGRLEAEPAELPAFTERLDEAALLDGRLLLTAGGQTLALPLPAGGAGERAAPGRAGR